MKFSVHPKHRDICRRLFEIGTLPKSACGQSLIRFFKPLLDSGVLHWEKSAGGQRLATVNRAAFERWLFQHFPTSQLKDDIGSSRIQAVAQFRDSKALAAQALARVGLADRFDHQPSELSGGQQQRVAIARALVMHPRLLLADEPTGNLDSRTSIDIMALFQELNDQGITIVLVTHEPDVARYVRRRVEVRDGRIMRDEAIVERRRAADDLALMPAEGSS